MSEREDRLPDHWPPGWRLAITWGRLPRAVSLAFVVNVLLAVADVGHERRHDVLVPVVVLVWVMAAQRHLEDVDLPTPDRAALPVRIRLFEVGLVLILAVPLVGMQIVDRTEARWWGAVAVVIAAALVVVRPPMAWRDFAALPAPEVADEPNPRRGFVVVAIGTVAFFGVAWWLLANVYDVDLSDRLLDLAIGVGVVAWTVYEVVRDRRDAADPSSDHESRSAGPLARLGFEPCRRP